MRDDNQPGVTDVSPVSARTDRATNRRRTDMVSRTLTAALAAASLTSLTGLAGLASPAPASAAPPRTHLTLKVAGCNGCHFRLTQAIDGRQEVWQSRSRTVQHGSVAWTLPTSRTRGLSITVLAPWDGGPGYVPTVAFRYAGTQVGDRITDAVAKTKRRASTCWAGTASSAATIRVTVVHARSTNPPGDPIRTPRAFTAVTQPWDGPMYRAWHGMSGTQEASYCG